MVPTPVKRTVSLGADSQSVSSVHVPWRIDADEPLSEIPWPWPKPAATSRSPSPPRPPVPTRPPPPIPSAGLSSPDMSEKVREPELPHHVLAQLVASLEGGKDINNLKQNLQSDGAAPSTHAWAEQLERDRLADEHPRRPSMPQNDNTQHSHHSSKNSAGHSYVFAGGRSHKASLASTGSSSRRMTMEEKMSEVDEFFAVDDDEEGVVLVATGDAEGGCRAGEVLVEGALVELNRLVGASENEPDGELIGK